MNIRKLINVLFVSLPGLLMPGQILAQVSDSALIHLGYDMTIPADEVSSAVGVATADDLSKFFTINPVNALYGQIPGLMILQNGGDWWNQSAGMYVRGQSNLDNTSAPLVLIDGFERSLSSITAMEIESITVLKDAASTAIYGQRGANGVILVTTKRGVYSGLQVDLSYERSTNQAFRLPQMLDAYGYASAMNEALALDGKDYLYSFEQLEAYRNGTYPEYFPNTNWYNEVLRPTGFIDDFNATFRGGSSKTRYFVAMNYLGGEGLLDQDRNSNGYSTQLDYDRVNIRTNLDIEVTKSTSLRFNLAGRISGTNRPGKATSENIFSTMIGTPANAYPVLYSDGSWGGTSVYSQNPVAEINSTGFSSTHERTFYADLSLVQDLDVLLEGLSITGSVSFDNNVAYWDSKRKDFSYVYRTAEIDEINQVLYNYTSTTYGEETALVYSTSFGGQNRHANGIVRLNYDQQWGKHQVNALALMHLDNEVGLTKDHTFKRINNAGYIHYAYDNRYMADLTMSYSGNNILPAENRYRLYPALSLGWVLSEEQFMSNVNAVNLLKLRGSVGLSGLEPNVQYLDIASFGSGGNYYFEENNTSQAGLQENRRANPDIDPEKNLMANLGFDARLFDGLSINADAFYEKRSQILVSDGNSTSNVIGVAETLVAEGVVENKGFELGASWTQSVGEFNYTIGAQYSFTRNKILEQNEVYREWDYLWRTGNSLGQAFGLQDDGFWGENDGLNGVDNVAPDGTLYTFTQVLKPGDVKYVDQNGDHIIDDFDVVPIGYSWLPEIYFSFSLNASYKGFGFYALFQGVRNVSAMLNTTDIFWPLYNNNNISVFSNDRWTPETAETATLPRLTPEINNNNYRASTIWQRDASFLKLRTVEVYYNLPESVVRKAKLNTARVFVRGLNLFSLDNIKIMDPEELTAVYPTLKSINVGASIGF